MNEFIKKTLQRLIGNDEEHITLMKKDDNFVIIPNPVFDDIPYEGSILSNIIEIKQQDIDGSVIYYPSFDPACGIDITKNTFIKIMKVFFFTITTIPEENSSWIVSIYTNPDNDRNTNCHKINHMNNFNCFEEYDLSMLINSKYKIDNEFIQVIRFFILRELLKFYPDIIECKI